jgi:outer membrane protein OmpA-like peptidoglycan-associated protein
MMRYWLPILSLFASLPVGAQAIKTNLLYDATATVNLGVELRTGGRTSLDIPVSYNPWEWKNGRKWQHLLVQPSLRLWTREAFRGHFFGVHGHWAAYNLTKTPLSNYMERHHAEGWLAGAGVSWGYRWKWNSHWGMEFELGAGWVRLDNTIYECGHCGDLLKKEIRNYFGPTKIALNLLYAFGNAAPRGTRCLAVQALVSEPAAPEVPAEPERPVPTFVVPEPEGPKARRTGIRADVEFVFDVSRLDPSYRNNAPELRKIIAAIDDLRRDIHITITAVNIVGYASPEGAEAYNMRLSWRRAVSLRTYLQAGTGLGEALFTARGEGERPDGLRAMAEVEYTVKPFTTDEALLLLHTRPEMLSVEEMFRLACTHDPASREYREAFEIAAATYPDNDTANINAAAAALLDGDDEAAMAYLKRVKTHSQAWWDNILLINTPTKTKKL